MKASKEIIDNWAAYPEYTDFCMRNGFLCCVGRFIFTWGVMVDLDKWAYWGRFCFDTKANAVLFLEEWDGYTFPVVGIDGCTAIKNGERVLDKVKESPN